jgi:hypothetical protein
MGNWIENRIATSDMRVLSPMESRALRGLDQREVREWNPNSIERIVKKAAILRDNGGEVMAPLLVRRGDDVGESTLKRAVEVYTADPALMNGFYKVGDYSSRKTITADDLVVLVKTTDVRKVPKDANVEMSEHARTAGILFNGRGSNFFVLFPEEVGRTLNICLCDDSRPFLVSFESAVGVQTMDQQLSV